VALPESDASKIIMLQTRSIRFRHFTSFDKQPMCGRTTASNSGLYKIFFIMPNGDMYLLEPYSIQQTLTVNNYASRDYFQGAIKTNDIYVGNVIIAKAASGGQRSCNCCTSLFFKG
jgi:hypothetical protein